MTKKDLHFSKYVDENLIPKAEEGKEVSEHYAIIQEILGEKETFRSGSYARLTSLSPVNDLDVIYVLPNYFLDEIKPENRKAFYLKEKEKIDPNTLDIKNIIAHLAEEIRKKYIEKGLYVFVEEQTHSVGIYFHSDQSGQVDRTKFSLDIVPAIKEGVDSDGNDTYYVPEILTVERFLRSKFVKERLESGGEIDWIKSNPRAYIEESKALREKYSTYRVAVLIIKKWKNVCKTLDESFKLKSFHLEQLVARYIEKSDKTVLGILELVFNNFNFEKSAIKDKADNGRKIDSYLEELDVLEKSILNDYVKKAKKDIAFLKNLDLDSEIDIEEFLNLKSKSVSEEMFSPSLTVSPQPRYNV